MVECFVYLITLLLQRYYRGAFQPQTLTPLFQNIFVYHRITTNTKPLGGIYVTENIKTLR